MSFFGLKIEIHNIDSYIYGCAKWQLGFMKLSFGTGVWKQRNWRKQVERVPLVPTQGHCIDFQSFRIRARRHIKRKLVVLPRCKKVHLWRGGKGPKPSYCLWVETPFCGNGFQSGPLVCQNIEGPADVLGRQSDGVLTAES